MFYRGAAGSGIPARPFLAARRTCHTCLLVFLPACLPACLQIQQMKKYNACEAVELGPLDYVKFAESFGAKGGRRRVAAILLAFLVVCWHASVLLPAMVVPAFHDSPIKRPWPPRATALPRCLLCLPTGCPFHPLCCLQASRSGRRMSSCPRWRRRLRWTARWSLL